MARRANEEDKDYNWYYVNIIFEKELRDALGLDETKSDSDDAAVVPDTGSDSESGNEMEVEPSSEEERQSGDDYSSSESSEQDSEGSGDSEESESEDELVNPTLPSYIYYSQADMKLLSQLWCCLQLSLIWQSQP
ncbi:hypothetical protein C8J56DRAFT_896498 [Mycena floridula]|nr:hypothetical protein C8J56DRAFT_896498 [Mycena floridula]